MGQHADGGAGQMLGAQLHARLADGQNFAVGGRIMALGNLIGALGQNLSALTITVANGPPPLDDVLPS
jgi:hypothetical protein